MAPHRLRLQITDLLGDLLDGETLEVEGRVDEGYLVVEVHLLDLLDFGEHGLLLFLAELVEMVVGHVGDLGGEKGEVVLEVGGVRDVGDVDVLGHLGEVLLDLGQNKSQGHGEI